MILSLALATAAMPALAEEAASGAMEAGTPVMASAGEVARAVFTTAITEREPADDVTQLGSDVTQVYFFTELHGMEGQRIVHRWEHNGQVMAEVGFDVGSNRWRVWSSKSLMSEWSGQWSVSVVNASGEVLASREMNYGAQ